MPIKRSTQLVTSVKNLIFQYYFAIIFISIFLARYSIPALFFDTEFSSLGSLQVSENLAGIKAGFIGLLAIIVGFLIFNVRFYSHETSSISTRPVNAYSAFTIGVFLFLAGYTSKFINIVSEDFSYQYSDPCGDFFMVKYFLSPNVLHLWSAIVLFWGLTFSTKNHSSTKIQVASLVLILWVSISAFISPDTGRNPIISIAFGILVLQICVRQKNMLVTASCLGFLILGISAKNVVKDVSHLSIYGAHDFSNELVCDSPTHLMPSTDRDIIELLGVYALGKCQISRLGSPPDWLKQSTSQVRDISIRLSQGICSNKRIGSQTTHYEVGSIIGEKSSYGSPLEYMVDVTLGRLNQIHVISYLVNNERALNESIGFSLTGLIKGSWDYQSEVNLGQELFQNPNVGVGANVLGELYLMGGNVLIFAVFFFVGALLNLFTNRQKNAFTALFIACYGWPLIHHFEQSIPPMVNLMVRYAIIFLTIKILYHSLNFVLDKFQVLKPDSR